MKYFLVLAVALDVHATSIVILRSAAAVYIGADSRRTYRGAGEYSSDSVCKIVPAGRFLFLASGLTYAKGQQVADIGAEIGRRSNTVAEAVEAFREQVAPYLVSALKVRSALEASPSGGLVLEAAFVGIEAGVPKVTIEWFRVAGGTMSSDRRTYESQSPKQYDFLFLGRRNAIDRYFANRYMSPRDDLAAVQLIRRLIGIEIAESPRTTAPPIDILKLTNYGEQWLQQKAGCDTFASSR